MMKVETDMSASRECVRIGGASGFWGDSAVAAPQLVQSGEIDYLVFDYLAELTMSILSGVRLKRPDLGYATDFVEVAMKQVLRDVVERGIHVVTNAGGVNPQACANALMALADEQEIEVKIAVITGDDVLPDIAELQQQSSVLRPLGRSEPFPAKLLSASAYLGALPIKAALDEGAQVVITGRCVDSAVTLGILMHEFGWRSEDYDLLASGSLAGHIIECGAQATGGLHTDWHRVPDWPHIGYPIVRCEVDGSFTVTKPTGTGGLVTPAVVAEQMLYEIGDPRAYLLPDVICDFTGVTMSQNGADRVRVSSARGTAPTDFYKVSATYAEGFRCSAQLTVVGLDAAAKARRTGEAILTRTQEILQAASFAPFSDHLIEVLGAESCWGSHARCHDAREVVLRLTVTHADKEALQLFGREIAAAGTSWAPGTTGIGGRPAVSASIRQHAFLVRKSKVTPEVHLGGSTLRVAVPSGTDFLAQPPSSINELLEPCADSIELPLVRLAWARSGDKGNTSNIGVIARTPALVPLLRTQLTCERVAAWLAHLVCGPVTRYEVPGINAFNFVCEEALDGGGMASLRNDPLGKGMAQILLAMPIKVPPALYPG